MKKQVGKLDAIPSKRLFLSIIADYDLNRSICELVDNGLDVWTRSRRKARVAISVHLDKNQQTITVRDNAGGIKREELSFIVGPGQTGSEPTDETIGIFGVGTKRAVVALAQDVKIRTRFMAGASYQVEFDDTWLSDEDWKLPLFEVDEIDRNTTIVDLSRLRLTITDEAISQLSEHLSATYGKFLQNEEVAITLNGVAIRPTFFDNWAYPPKYEPRHFTGDIPTSEHGLIRVSAYAGLSNESSPASGEYGVYFYCNNRLIARGLKNYDVGFMRGFAGLPHPKVSLTKVIVDLQGDARAMPWNSSKSDISAQHEVFQSLHQWLINAVKNYATLSRIWMGDWPNKVFAHTRRKIVEVAVDDFPTANTSYLPPVPRSRFKFADKVSAANKRLSKTKPWVTGLFEGIIAADVVSKQDLEQANRITLIILDSTMEIALKEYLVNESGQYYSNKKLNETFESRHKVITEVKKYTTIPESVWKKLAHYNGIRNNLIHQRATGTVRDSEIQDFRDTVERVLKVLFDLKFV